MPYRRLSLRTRVARRILTLFVVSALAPLCAFAGLALWMVGAEIREQAASRLRVDTKGVAMSAVERLQRLESELRINAAGLSSDDARLRERARAHLDAAIAAAGRLDAADGWRPIFGDITRPVLSAGHAAQLATHGTVLFLGASERAPVHLVVQIADDGSRLVARLDARRVWDLGEDSTRPAGAGLCVFERQHGWIACSDDLEDQGLRPALSAVVNSSSGSLAWTSADGAMLGAWWSAPLGQQFGVSSLGFVLTSRVADVERPIARFRRAFALVVTLTVALIVWVSLRQIRHTLAPLERLRQMADSLQGGRFDARVSVSSNDEFAALGASFNLMAEEVQRTFGELKAMNVGTLEALARAIDAKSPWTAGHSQRVTALGVRIGREMGMSPDTLEHLHWGGLLHDLGKLGIPSRILDKPAPLTDEEFAIMKSHPALGARILEPVPQYAPVIPIVLQHHERFDGSGYPRGLAGEAIDLGARIFAVADVVDAMSSTRPYRGAIAMATVAAYIRGQSGRYFDPQVVDAFLQVVDKDGLLDQPALPTPEPLPVHASVE